MKTSIPRELKNSLLLFLWLLLVQTVCALCTLVVDMLALVLMAFGGNLVLGGSTPLWVWIVCGGSIFLFWLVMGRFAPHAVRPGPAWAVAVLTVWAVLTSLMRNMDLLLLAQRTCGGMLEKILQSLSLSSRFDKGRALTTGCFLLPASLGIGLLLGQKRTEAPGHDG